MQAINLQLAHHEKDTQLINKDIQKHGWHLKQDSLMRVDRCMSLRYSVTAIL